MDKGLTDRYGRRIDYLRISLTDRCSLRCIYCMPEENSCGFLPAEELLTEQEWILFVQGAALAGIRKVRLTGGEPLMRQDLVEIVRGAASVSGIRKVVMTTNGVGLAEKAEALKEAGLAGINLSLDSLEKECYRKITQRDSLTQALEGLKACRTYGIPVKINCVPVGTLNREQWVSLAELAVKEPIQVRFIEMMPIGDGKSFEPVPCREILKVLEQEFGPLFPAEQEEGAGPARLFSGQGFAGNIGFISAVRHGACAGCNRIRATADGKIKLCLHHPPEGDLRALLRQGAGPEEIRDWLCELVKRKPAGGHHTDEVRPMWKIGG